MSELWEEKFIRYRRQFVLPEVGLEGQKKINAARVLLVGAGGLGSSAGYYLAAAGVGKIGIIDDDIIELSNLQRQILYHNNDVGKPKVDLAKRTLEGLNPDIKVLAYRDRLTPENMPGLIDGYDFIVDCSDNFPTRYLINDVCVRARKPFFYGAVSGFEGQAMTIIPGLGPCYRCLYPAPPRPEKMPANEYTGVIGVLPGLIGIIQATELIKMVLGQGDLLIGKVLFYDALSMDFLKFEVKLNPVCSACQS